MSTNPTVVDDLRRFMVRDQVAPNDILYIPRLGIVFAFISKNASSLMKSYLHSVARGDRPNARRGNPHNLGYTGFLGISAVGVPQMSNWLLDDSIPKVVLGRHPVDRLVSAWRSRVRTWLLQPYQSAHELDDWARLRQEILGFAHGLHAMPARYALTREISLAQVIDYVLATPSPLLERHLAPQTFLCASDLIRYDLVGQVEEIETFIAKLDKLVPVDLPPLDGLVLNSSKPTTPSLSQLTDCEEARIRERFREDYEFFGYPLQGGHRT